MKSLRYLPFLLLSALISLGSCGDDSGGFTGVNNPPGAGSAGAGGFGGGNGAAGGGAGTGGGGPLSITPDLARQVEPGAAVVDIKISGDASFLIYRSNEALPGGQNNNPNGAIQVFLSELGFDIPVQVTRAPSSNSIADGVFDVTDDGRVILFSSTQDLVNQNSALSQNLFIARNSGQLIAQVTDNISVSRYTEWQISGDGSYAVFATDLNLLGTNPDVDIELYRINIDGPAVQFQITSDTANPSDIRLADESDRIAYLSNGNPLGTNADLNEELFVINVDGSGHRQLTNTIGTALDIVGPEISDSGDRIVFVSNRDLVGTNDDASYEVFVIDANTAAITQVTSSNLDSGVFAGNAGNAAPGDVDISGNGEYVVFGSTANFTQQNPNNGHTIFWASSDGLQIGQPLRAGTVVTSATSFEAENVGLSDDGNTIIFDSLENFSVDATGNDRKIYTQNRQ